MAPHKAEYPSHVPNVPILLITCMEIEIGYFYGSRVLSKTSSNLPNKRNTEDLDTAREQNGRVETCMEQSIPHPKRLPVSALPAPGMRSILCCSPNNQVPDSRTIRGLEARLCLSKLAGCCLASFGRQGPSAHPRLARSNPSVCIRRTRRVHGYVRAEAARHPEVYST